MPINTLQLKTYIIEDCLKSIGLYSGSAVNLLLGTFAQESHMGTFLKQIGKGPALGIGQMEPKTHDDIWLHFLYYKDELAKLILNTCGYTQNPGPQALLYNLRYATCMTRAHYRRVPERLPTKDDLDGLARYWKKYYNTYKGRGTVDEFKKNYHDYVS